MMERFRDNGPRYNLLNSTVLDILEIVRKVSRISSGGGESVNILSCLYFFTLLFFLLFFLFVVILLFLF